MEFYMININNNTIKNMKKLFLLALTAAFAWCCTEPDEFWKEDTDAAAPGAPKGTVSVDSVVNIPGGSIIYFKHATDADILGTKAYYSINDEEKYSNLEAFVSKYVDSLFLQGFGKEAGKRTVTLVPIDQNLNEGTAKDVTIEPMPNVLEDIIATLDYFPFYDGIGVRWQNPTKADVALSLSVYNADMDIFEPATSLIFNSNSNVEISIKGLEQEVLKKYRFEFMDRWKNYSSPVDAELSPLREDTIWSRDPLSNAPIWSRYQYDEQYNGYNMWTYRGEVENYLPFDECMDLSWNNTMGWDAGAGPEKCLPNMGVTTGRTSAPYPLYFTMDMGRVSTFSTLIYHFRPRDPVGSSDFPVDFEIWGSVNPPKDPSEIGDGSHMANLKYWTSWEKFSGSSEETTVYINGEDTWKNDGWTLLGSFYYLLPSGVHKGTGWPNSTLSAEDQAIITAGYVYNFPFEAASVPVRYLRWVVKEDSKDARKFTCLEMEFKGRYAD
jgi:hypothetical protein